MKKHTLYVTVIIFICMISFAGADELVHVLQKGETLYGVSRKYNVPASAIMSWNNIDDPGKLKAGQKLKIPDVYTVQKGDTLYGIARKLDISVENLLSANHLKNDSKLKMGESLYIPSPEKTEGTGSTSAMIVQKPSYTVKVSEKPSVPDMVTGNSVLPQKPLEDPRGFEKRKVDASIIWPVSVKDLSYLSGKVYGVSIISSVGEKVKVISSGTVLSTGPYRGFGQVLFVQSKTGYIYVYGGLDSITSKPGQNLAFGDEIGTLGSDSLSGTPRLYFMVYNKDIPVDPAKAPRGY